MHCSILIARCRIAVLERNGAAMARNAEAAGLQEAAWRLMKRRCVARLFGPGSAGRGDHSRLAASGQGARCRIVCCQSAANQYIPPDRAIISCVTQVCVAKGLLRSQTRGLKKPEVQASGIAGPEELQNLRDCSASAVVPANVLRAGGPRIGCCDHRAASVLSCATQSIRRSA